MVMAPAPTLILEHDRSVFRQLLPLDLSQIPDELMGIGDRTLVSFSINADEQPAIPAVAPRLPQPPLRAIGGGLSDRDLRIANIYRPIILSKGLQAKLPIHALTLSLETDEEDGLTSVVLRVLTESSMVQALAFWDSLERAFDAWLPTLDAADRRTAMERIAIRFGWAA